MNHSTGEVRPGVCLRLSCVVCVRICALRYARAIGLARPERHVLLTRVGDNWPQIRKRMNALRARMRRCGALWMDVYHVEPNPLGTGSHVHAWQWGDEIATTELSITAEAVGMGGWCDVQPRRERPGAPLSYGMKQVIDGSPDGDTIPEETKAFLDLNGSRLAHATPGFWRDERGGRLSGVRAAVLHSQTGRLDAEWVMLPKESG